MKIEFKPSNGVVATKEQIKKANEAQTEKEKKESEAERKARWLKAIKQNRQKYNDLPTEVDESRYLLKDYIPISRKTMTLISGSGGIGKSLFLLQLALIATSENLKVLCLFSEDDSFLIKQRIDAINENIFNNSQFISNYKQITPNFDNLTLETGDKTECFSFLEYSQKYVDDQNKRDPKYEGFDYIKKEVLEESLKEFDIVIIDPLISYYQDDENNNQKARMFCDVVNDIAKTNNQAIIFIHHNSKDGLQMRGASAFRDGCRVAYNLDLKKETFENLYVNNNFFTNTIKLEKDNVGVGQFFKTRLNNNKDLKVNCFKNAYDEESLSNYLKQLSYLRKLNREIGVKQGAETKIKKSEYWRFIYYSSIFNKLIYNQKEHETHYKEIEDLVNNGKLDYLYTAHRIFIIKDSNGELIEQYSDSAYKHIIKKINEDFKNKALFNKESLKYKKEEKTEKKFTPKFISNSEENKG